MVLATEMPYLLFLLVLPVVYYEFLTEDYCSPEPCKVFGLYRDAGKSLARTTEKTIERSPFFVRRGGHCCRRDLVGWTTF